MRAFYVAFFQKNFDAIEEIIKIESLKEINYAYWTIV